MGVGWIVDFDDGTVGRLFAELMAEVLEDFEPRMSCYPFIPALP